MEPDVFTKPLGTVAFAPGTSIHAFTPKPLPHEFTYTPQLVKKLEQATHSLGQLSRIGRTLMNPNLLITPYLRKEALASSRIEGTQTTLSNVFRGEATSAQTTPDDVEVLNHVAALEFCLKALSQGATIDHQLLKDAHRILLKDGVRGHDLNPGTYKSELNFNGAHRPEEATFVFAPPSSVEPLLDNLIDYIERDTGSILLNAGLLHYQFEAIHPFRDGNGRIGRLLIITYLTAKGAITDPLLYLSPFFEQHKQTYYDRLYDASTKSALEPWLSFFLDAIYAQANDAVSRASELAQYHEYARKLLVERHQSTNVLLLLDQLFANPYMTVKRARTILNAHYGPAKYDIDILTSNGILEPVDPLQKRNRQYFAPKILNILTGEQA